MTKAHIATYLNDHLAGSVAALELLDQLIKTHHDAPLASFFTTLRTEIAGERQELEALIEQIDASKSVVRQASAWFSEKMSRLKLLVDDPADGDFRLFESLEALALGIEGKTSLWRALSAATEDAPELRGADYARLIQQSEDQRNRVETERVAAAKRAFATPADADAAA